LLQGSSGNNVGDVARGDWKHNGTQGSLRPGENWKKLNFGELFRGVLLWGLHQVKKISSGTEKDTLMVSFFCLNRICG